MNSQKLLPAANESSSAVLQELNNAAIMEYGVKAALAPIPSDYYPDNPAQKDVIPHVDGAYASAAQLISLAFSVINVTSTWASFKELYYAKNKNLEKWANFGFNFLKMSLWFSFIGVAAAGLVFVAPYMLVAMAGLGVVYGVGNMVKHGIEAYRANKERDLESRNKHLSEIPKQALLTAVSVLSLIFGIDTAIGLNGQIEAAMKLNESGEMLPALMMMKSVGAGFVGLKTLFYAVAAAATLGAISSKSTWETNLETFHAIAHPMQTFRKGKDLLIEKCKSLVSMVKANPVLVLATPIIVAFEAISAVTQLTARVVTFVCTPLLAAGALLRKSLGFAADKIANLFAKNKEPSLTTPLMAQEAMCSTEKVIHQLHSEHAQLKNSIVAQLVRLDSVAQTPKIKAKKLLLEGLQVKLGPDTLAYDETVDIKGLEQVATQKSSNLYQSFWRAEGKTEQLVRQAKQFDSRRQAAMGA
jgi:hypothetical protein